ncbi:hypothetical protein BYT27DRAFT_7104486 [Phlegmacium glaucopus]|nr:hypothetical protein BYT27DRAFT_7104486 [Phlegmacium glaucopus]
MFRAGQGWPGQPEPARPRLFFSDEGISPISVYHSAVASFYAPSDPSGIQGMHCEWIQSTPSWRYRAPILIGSVRRKLKSRHHENKRTLNFTYLFWKRP